MLTQFWDVEVREVINFFFLFLNAKKKKKKLIINLNFVGLFSIGGLDNSFCGLA